MIPLFLYRMPFNEKNISFIIGCLNSTAHFYLLKHNNIPMGHIDHLWNKSIELKFVAKLWLYYIFIKRGNLFSLFCYYLYSEKRIPLHLNKLISLFTTQGYVVLREVEIGWTPWFWRRFQNFANECSFFRYYVHLEKDMTVHLNKLKSTLHK